MFNSKGRKGSVGKESRRTDCTDCTDCTDREVRKDRRNSGRRSGPRRNGPRRNGARRPAFIVLYAPTTRAAEERERAPSWWERTSNSTNRRSRGDKTKKNSTK